MNPITSKRESQAIVYDADAIPVPEEAMFEAAYWRAEGRLTGTAPGRGMAWFLDTPWGEAVLRRYLRGGMIARISHDHYLYTGLEASRPWREFDLLRRASEAGLNVPAPLAAACERRAGLVYRGALLTRRISPARPLHDRLDEASVDWRAVGAGLRGFHEAGLDHADLNARNILIHDRSGEIWLLDLDRSRFHPRRKVDGRRNLARLKRSLEKLWPDQGPDLPACWQELIHGYDQ